MKKDSKCIHFNGIMEKTCRAGVNYKEAFPGPGLPCIAFPGVEHNHVCEKKELPTPEEIAADEAAFKRTMDLMAKGLSSCCEAPFNETAVIRSGPHKNHGPRYCSKCGKLCFMV